MSLRRDRFLFIDCQSTGAHPRNGNLLELAWCFASADDDPPQEINCRLVKQPDDQTIPFRIQMITGITENDMSVAVEGQSLYRELVEQIGTISSGKAVAHYASFERPFLSDLFERHGDATFPLELVCTYQIARRLFPDLPTRGIRGLGGFFGASDRELKRSSHHVETTWSIWKGLVAELEKEGITDAAQLHEWLQKPARKRQGSYQFPITPAKRLALPNCPGIYKMLNKKGEVLYVGKATSLKSRVNSYFTGRKGKDARKLEMATQTHDIGYIECGSALEAALLETDEIKKHDPPYNLSLKTRQRKLAFFATNLFSSSNIHSAEHPVGPFSSVFVMEQFRLVFEWLETGVPDVDIFHGEVSEALMQQGFDLFCQIEQIEPLNILTHRDLMALAIRLLRRQKFDEEGLPPIYDVDDEALDEEADESEESLAEFTAEDVAGKFGRLLKRAAKAYLRGKVMTRLLNCSLSFNERSHKRKLTIIDGAVSSNESSLDCHSSASSDTAGAWLNHDVSTYDRLSVLLAEIVKLNARGSLTLNPPVPLNLVSKPIVRAE